MIPKKTTPAVEEIIRYSEAVRRQFIPDEREKIDMGFDDPLSEEGSTPFPFLIKRYPDRAVLIVTERCPVFCRFCNRRRFFGSSREIGDGDFIPILNFIKENPLYEIIISGGEPFLLDNGRIKRFVEMLRKVGIKVIRVSTRAPFTIPDRFDTPTFKLLEDLSPIWIALHINHPDEITQNLAKIVENMRRSGVSLVSQTVLLKSVNDEAYILEELFRELVSLGVKPYYLYQCDEVKGASHFRVPLDRAIELMKELRGRISGLCYPYFVVDGRGGKGKVPLVPNYVIEKNRGRWKLRNYKGEEFIYEWPL